MADIWVMEGGVRAPDWPDERAEQTALLGGRYRLIRLIKRASGIDTYLGSDIETGAPVVVKRALAEAVSPSMRLRLEHEADVLSRLVEGGRPLLEGFRIEPERAWLVQRFLPGETLEQRLRRGPLSCESTLAVAADVLKMLARAHEAGVLHRDVKPANIIVSGERALQGASLIDFGLARSVWLDAAIREEAVGTARYASPEQAGLVDRPADARSDLYSLGVVLFECLAGTAPFTGEIGEVLRQHVSRPAPDLRATGIAVPRAVSDLVQRLMRKDPAERYQSALAALADVEAIVAALRDGATDPAVVIGRSEPRTRLTGPSFVGRERELRALLDTLERPARAAAVVVEGQSGSGKSRLLEELALEASTRSVRVLRGQGVDQVGQRPFQLFDGVASGIVAWAGDRPDELARLRARLGEQAEAVVAALPRLESVLGTSPPDLPEQYGEARSVNALVALLDALGTPEEPTLVLLDDCQWADSVTVRVLAQWSRQQAERDGGASVVAAYRSDEVGPASPLRSLERVSTVALGPLDDDEVLDLARSMAGPLPDAALDVLIGLSEGSPFMAEAVLRGMVECGALVDHDGEWRLDRAALREVQTSRRAALFLIRRLELLSTEAGQLLQAAAVLGKEFDLRAALSLGGLSPARAVPVLDEARRRGILWVDEGPGRARFLHDKLREAVLERTEPDRRRSLHLEAARRFQSDPEDRSFELAYHFDASGRHTDALPHAVAAAEQARARYALDVAESHYRIAARGTDAVDATDVRTRARVAEGLADILMLRGSYAEAEAQLERALAITDEPLRRAAISGKLGEAAFKQGDQREACRQLEGALRQLDRRVPRRPASVALALGWELVVQVLHCLLGPLLAKRRRAEASPEETQAMRLYSRLAYAYWFRSGRAPCAWAHLRGMNMAERHPPSAELAQAYSEHAPVMTMVPWFTRGIAYAQRSLAIRTELGDVWGQGQSLHFYGVVLYAASRYRESIEKCEEAVRILSRTGDQWEVNTATWHIGFSRYRLGAFGQSQEICERLYRQAMEIGDRSSAGIALSGWSRASNGRVPSEALAAELDRKEDDVHTATEVRMAQAVHLLAEGRAADAVAVLGDAWAMVRRAGLRQEYVAPVLPWLATALRTQIGWMPPDDPRRPALIRRARRVARRATRLSRRYRNNLPHARREQALIALAAGRTRRCARLLGQSLAIAQAQGAAGEEARTVIAQSRVGGVLGWAAPGRVAPEEVLRGLDDLDDDGEADSPAEEVSLSLADRFSGLLAAGRAIASATEPAAVYAAVRESALALLRIEQCHIIEVGAEPVAGSPPGPGEGFSRSVVQQAVDTGRTVIASPEGSGSATESLVLSGVRSVLCAPISCEGRVVSCLYAAHRDIAGLFGPAEQQVAEFIATLSGAALEHVAGSQAHFRGLVQNSYDITVVVDRDGRVTYVSPSVTRILGHRPEDLIGEVGFAFVHPHDIEAASQSFLDVVAEPFGHRAVELQARDAAGAWRWLELSHTNMLDDPAVGGVVINVQDITERKQAELAFADATEQFRVAFENAPIGMALTSIQPDGAGTFLRVNQALADMLGLGVADLLGRRFQDLTHPDNLADDLAAVRRLQQGEVSTYETDKRYRHADGHWIWVHLKAALVVTDKDEPGYVVSQFVDITERRDAEEQLTYQALHDPLTGLPNRRLFLDRLSVALSRSERRIGSVAVLYLDVDRFKVINDSLGHDVGDRVLMETGKRLQSLVRECDTLARHGGDEFVLLVEDLEEPAEAAAIAQRIEEALALPVPLPGDTTIAVSTSIGIAIAGSGADAVSLLRDADTAMYRAKEQGRARHAMFDEQLRNRAVGRLKVERELRAALEDSRLVLHYQPVIDLKWGRIAGAEALVRYSDQSGRVIYPDRFIAVAEETGLINRLGDWVVQEGCRQLAAWKAAGLLSGMFRLSVNVSPRQLSDGVLADTVAECLAATGMSAEMIAIEITEAALVDTMDASLPTLNRLRAMGCSIGIDDFGTGYSSLEYLRRLPLDFIKIDKAFINGLEAGDRATAIVQAVMRLADALQLTTVAEGLETEAQELAIREFGCRFAQGYRLGRPTSADKLTELLCAEEERLRG